MSGKKNGRPTIFTNDVLDKLEYVFALGGTDKEACLYAGVSPAALYKYQEKNPDFVERKEMLKETPVLAAREKVVKSINRDSRLAFEYLKAKKRDEFADRRELTGKDGQPIQVQTLADLVTAAANNESDPDANQSSSEDLESAA